MRIRIKKGGYFIICIIGAISTFFAVVDWNIVTPSNIDWIVLGDPWTHYLGWAFFRNGPFGNPIGLNTNYGLAISSSIVYSDSQPILAIPLKLLNNLLPNPFQYQGIWYFLCFILQGTFSYWLIRHFKISALKSLILSIFTIFTPIFLSTIGFAASLASHFLIIAGLILCVTPSKKRWYLWIALIVFSLGTHFYLFTMLFLMWVGNFLDYYTTPKSVSKFYAAKQVCIVLVLILIFAWQFGYFVNHSPRNADDFGYGLYRTHLLSFFDGKDWSYLMPAIRTSDKAYQEFKLSDGIWGGQSYLGLGAIFLVMYAIYLTINKFQHIKSHLRSNLFLIIVLITLAIFSLSYNITLLTWNLEVPLPDLLIKYLGIFRASNRFIWPLYYSILFFSFIVVAHFSNKKYVGLLLLLFLIIQIADTHQGWGRVNENLIRKKTNSIENLANNEHFKKIAPHYHSIIEVPLSYSSMQPNWAELGFSASTLKMSTNSVYLTRPNFKLIDAENNKYFMAISNGNYDSNSIYIIDEDLLIPALNSLEPKDRLVKLGKYILILPNWNLCQSCESLPENLTPLLTSSKNFYLEEAGLIEFNNKNPYLNQYLINLGKSYSQNNGWSYPESWGVWSEGKISKAIIPIPFKQDPKILRIAFRTLSSYTGSPQEFKLSINNGLSRFYSFNSPEGVIEVELSPYKNLKFLYIKFEMISTTIPRNVGIGDDNRALGVGLKSFEFGS